MVLKIYNRWGEKIFENNDQQNGWNGNFKSKELDSGVYAYFFESTLVNKDSYTKSGNINLIR